MLISGSLPWFKSSVKSKSWVCDLESLYNKAIEGSPLSCPIGIVPGRISFVFSLLKCLPDGFLPCYQFTSSSQRNVSFPASCISCDSYVRGTESTTQTGCLGRACLCSHQWRVQCRGCSSNSVISNCFLFSISCSIFRWPFSSWCQGGPISPVLHPPRFKSMRN